MLSKEEKNIVEQFQFYDKYRELPSKKVRIDITLSLEALEKIKGKNRSKLINDLIMQTHNLTT